MSKSPVVSKFWSNVEKTCSCWIWTGSRNRDGYGQLTMRNRRSERAHRVSWELFNGPVPSGLSVLHRCDNPPCVNPKHLWVGTHAQNMQDMVAKGRMAIVSGENNPRAKLTKQQVEEIRMIVSHDPHAKSLKHREIAALYGVSKSTVDQISRGIIWKETSNDR